MGNVLKRTLLNLIRANCSVENVNSKKNTSIRTIRINTMKLKEENMKKTMNIAKNSQRTQWKVNICFRALLVIVF